MEDKRKYLLNLILGIQGTGKTTFIVNIIKKLYKEKVCISVVKDDAESAYYDPIFQRIDLKKPADRLKLEKAKAGAFVIIFEKKETFPFLFKMATEFKLKKWILNLDDANTYYHPVPEDELKDLTRRRRQYSVDIFASAHGWSQVPVFVFDYVSHFTLFATKSKSIYDRENYLSSFEEIKRASDFVIQQHQLGNIHTHLVVDQYGKPIAKLAL